MLYNQLNSISSSSPCLCVCVWTQKKAEKWNRWRSSEGRQRHENKWIFFSFSIPCSPWIHPSHLSSLSDSNPSSLSEPTSSALAAFPSLLRSFGFPHHSVLSLCLQAWLTEIHEYAQQDVVVMLLGNKVRPCCQHGEMDGQMDSGEGGRECGGWWEWILDMSGSREIHFSFCSNVAEWEGLLSEQLVYFASWTCFWLQNRLVRFSLIAFVNLCTGLSNYPVAQLTQCQSVEIF